MCVTEFFIGLAFGLGIWGVTKVIQSIKQPSKGKKGGGGAEGPHEH